MHEMRACVWEREREVESVREDEKGYRGDGALFYSFFLLFCLLTMRKREKRGAMRKSNDLHVG